MNTDKRLLIINTQPDLTPWAETHQTLPPSWNLESCSLLHIHEWSSGKSPLPLIYVFIDIDAVAQTDSLDEWALSAWRSALNELIARAINDDGKVPTLVGFTREPNWERALIGVKVGVRDLVKMSRINERLGSSPFVDLPNAEEAAPRSSKIVSLEKARSQMTPVATAPSREMISIPKHVIPFPIEGLDGTSQAVEGLRSLIRRTAPLDTAVLITGATGSGKELVAKTLHRYSPRAQNPFVAVNCGAISCDLAESELFGHVRGAFTDAHSDKAGLFASAEGGTLFLDEISELPIEVQIKLLRALQEHSYFPVGSSEAKKLDVRLISACKDDLDERVHSGGFREDLLYRIKVIEIDLPALTERKSDIPEISKTILKKLARKHKRAVLELSDSVVEKFLLHAWPGNIRELENTLEHAATLCWADNRSEILTTDLPNAVQLASMNLPGSELHLKEVVKRFEKEFIASTVRRLGGSKEDAADVLGLSLATLYRKLGS